MFGFGKKQPLFDAVRKSDMRKIMGILENSRGNQHNDACALLIAYLIQHMASHFVKQGPPKNFGKVINADVFAFEALAYCAHVLEANHAKLTEDDMVDGYDEQFDQAMGMLSATADKLCGWQTGMVVLARRAEYTQRDATGMNLISTLMTVGDASHPMTEYLRPLDFREDQGKLSARVYALTGIGENYATTLVRAVEEYELAG